jgi:hypothetical protein
LFLPPSRMNNSVSTNGLQMNFESYELSHDGNVYSRTHLPQHVQFQNGKLWRALVLSDSGPINGYERLIQENVASLLRQGKRVGLPMIKELHS